MMTSSAKTQSRTPATPRSTIRSHKTGLPYLRFSGPPTLPAESSSPLHPVIITQEADRMFSTGTRIQIVRLQCRFQNLLVPGFHICRVTCHSALALPRFNTFISLSAGLMRIVMFPLQASQLSFAGVALYKAWIIG